MLISTGLSPVSIISWHLIICFPAVAIFTATKLYLLCYREKKIRLTYQLLASIVSFFVGLNIFAALGSTSHSYKNNFHQAAITWIENKKQKDLLLKKKM